MLSFNISVHQIKGSEGRRGKKNFQVSWLGFKKVIYLKVCLKTLMPREATGNKFALTVIALQQVTMYQA